jgi:hypothetical protein
MRDFKKASIPYKSIIPPNADLVNINLHKNLQIYKKIGVFSEIFTQEKKTPKPMLQAVPIIHKVMWHSQNFSFGENDLKF